MWEREPRTARDYMPMGSVSFDTPHVLPFILTYSCEGILQFYIKSIENIAFMF